MAESKNGEAILDHAVNIATFEDGTSYLIDLTDYDSEKDYEDFDSKKSLLTNAENFQGAYRYQLPDGKVVPLVLDSNLRNLATNCQIMPREEIESMKEKVSKEITSLQVLDDLDRMQTENGYTYNQTAKKYIANLFTKIFSTFKKSPSPTALIAASSVNEPILASNESNNKNDFREILSNDGKYVESTNEYLINLQRQGRKSQQQNRKNERG